jgi:hypothetical protein
MSWNVIVKWPVLEVGKEVREAVVKLLGGDREMKTALLLSERKGLAIPLR